MAILTGRRPFCPMGMAPSLPPIPTGTMGTPARDSHEGGALEEIRHPRARPSGAFGKQHHRFAGRDRRLTGP